MGKKKLWDVELLDTKTGNIIHRGDFTGRYPLEAQRKLAKTLPKSINLNETAHRYGKDYSRYVFLAGKPR